MTTTKHRITASLIVLTLLAIDGICIWALLQPGMVPMTWLWFGHLFFAVYFCINMLCGVIAVVWVAADVRYTFVGFFFFLVVAAQSSLQREVWNPTFLHVWNAREILLQLITAVAVVRLRVLS